MSALGQERTFAPQNVTSALPPIATTKATSLKNPCLPKAEVYSALVYVG